jgi:hypothetical protein
MCPHAPAWQAHERSIGKAGRKIFLPPEIFLLAWRAGAFQSLPIFEFAPGSRCFEFAASFKCEITAACRVAKTAAGRDACGRLGRAAPRRQSRSQAQFPSSCNASNYIISM